ncbi:MAG TPA: YbaK/EbsC family protein [Solirubrobacteraceae bacterium]
MNEPGPAAMTTTRVDAVVGFLEGAQVPYQLVQHTPVMSSGEQALAVEQEPERVAKTIILHDGEAYVIAAISAADRLDLHKLRDVLGASRHLRLASEPEIERDFPSMEVGAVPPFGPMVPLAEIIDARLAKQQQVLCAAGDHTHSVLIDPREIVRITAARVADICEE